MVFIKMKKKTLNLHFVAKSAILFSPIWLFSSMAHSWMIMQHHALFESAKKSKTGAVRGLKKKNSNSIVSAECDGAAWGVLAISSASQLESWLGLSLLNAVRRDGHADYPLMRKSLSLASVHNKHGGWFVSLITLKISLTPKADPKAALFTLSTRVT